MYVSTLFGKRGRDVGNNLVFIPRALYTVLTVLTTEVSFCEGNKLHLSEGETTVYMRKIIHIQYFITWRGTNYYFTWEVKCVYETSGPRG